MNTDSVTIRLIALDDSERLVQIRPVHCMPRVIMEQRRCFAYDSVVWVRNSYDPSEIYRYRELPWKQFLICLTELVGEGT